MKLDDAEALVLTTLLKSPEKRPQIFSMVTQPDDFFCRDETKQIYESIHKLHQEGGVVDLESVSLICPVPSQKIRDIYEKYEEIADGNISRVMTLVRDNSIENDFKTKYLVTMNDFLIDGTLSVEEKARRIKDILDQVEKRSESFTTNFKKIDVIAEEHKKVLEQRKGNFHHFSTGDFRLDALMTYGFAPGECTSIGGRPGNGKSFYAVHLARLLAMVGTRTALFNHEMSNASTMDRILSMSARIDANKLIRNFRAISEDELGRINNELAKLKDGIPLYFNDSTTMTLDECEKEICTLQNMTKQEYMVVFWDLFTKLKDFQNAKSAFDIEKICNRLQSMYKRLKIHAIPVLQINREADKERLKTLREVSKVYPVPSNIKNSDAFLEISDNMLLVCRPSYYLRRYDWGKFVPHYSRVELAKQRGPGTEGDNVLLYKNITEYMALAVPDEGWDPLRVTFEDV